MCFVVCFGFVSVTLIAVYFEDLSIVSVYLG